MRLLSRSWLVRGVGCEYLCVLEVLRREYLTPLFHSSDLLQFAQTPSPFPVSFMLYLKCKNVPNVPCTYATLPTRPPTIYFCCILQSLCSVTHAYTACLHLSMLNPEQQSSQSFYAFFLVFLVYNSKSRKGPGI